MSVRSVTTLSELRQIISSPQLTVVDFFAQWCGPCKQIAPMVHNLSSNHPNVNFIKVDVDKAGEIAAEYRIRAMPTFKLFKSGQVVEEFSGANFSLLERLVKKNDVTPAATKKDPQNSKLKAAKKATHEAVKKTKKKLEEKRKRK